jgi:hypothetical protein
VQRQFSKEIESLRLAEGATFHGYQGAPVSHLLDVMWNRMWAKL